MQHASTLLPSSSILLQRLGTQGDCEAWSQLVDRHAATMYRAAIAITGNADQADDVVQETLLHLKTRAKDFRPPKNSQAEEAIVKSWLTSLTTNVALNFLRSERRRKHREDSIRAWTTLETTTMPSSQEIDEEREKNATMLRAALADLGQEDRQLLLLKYTQNLDTPALAQVLSCRESAIRMRLHRATERLRKNLRRGGLALPLPAFAALLENSGQSWHNAVVSTESIAAYQAIFSSTRQPTLPLSQVQGGLSTMAITSIIGLGVVGTAGFTFWLGATPTSAMPSPNLRAEAPSVVTISATTPATLAGFSGYILAKQLTDAEASSITVAAPLRIVSNQSQAKRQEGGGMGMGGPLRIVSNQSQAKPQIVEGTKFLIPIPADKQTAEAKKDYLANLNKKLVLGAHVEVVYEKAADNTLNAKKVLLKDGQSIKETFVLE